MTEPEKACQMRLKLVKKILDKGFSTLCLDPLFQRIKTQDATQKEQTAKRAIPLVEPCKTEQEVEQVLSSMKI